MTRASFPRLLRLSAVFLVAGAAAFGLSSALRADEEPPQLQDKTSDDLQKLQPLVDAKNWTAARELLDGILARVDADSYDRSFVSNIAAKVAFEQDDVKTAITNWETCIQLSESHPNYLEPKDKLEIILYLAQGYYQLGQTPHLPEEEEREDFIKSTDYIKRWIDSAGSMNPKPSLDTRINTQIFYTGLLYTQATIDEKHIDQGLLREAAEQAEVGLHLNAHPQEKFYQILVACAQQSGNLDQASHYLELLTWRYPKSSQYWQNLWYCYEMLAAENEKNEEKSHQYIIRAINAQERAQSFGFMNKPRDNYNLFTLYYQVNQFGKATDILLSGLRQNEEDKQAGIPPDQRRGIESTVANWENLASAYQQNDQPRKAIAALKEASAAFPDEGTIDLQMGEIYYYQLDDYKDAYNSFIACTAKPHLQKPYQAWMFAAYTAYSMEDYKAALEAINHAETYPEAEKDKQLEVLKQGVEENVKSQEEQAAVKKAS